VPEIEVTFELDANGILNVKARDLGTGKAQSTRIVSSSGLSEDDVDKMIQEADIYRAEDQRRREVAEAKNQLDGLVYNTARSFDEFGDQLEKEDADELRAALRNAESAMDSADLDFIQEAHDILFEAAQSLADAIYGGLRDTIDEFDDDFDDDLDDDFDEFDAEGA